MQEVMAVIGMLAAVAFILFLAYWATKLISRFSITGGRQPAGNRRRLQVMEQLTVGKDQKLMVVKVGESYFLLGFSGSGVTMLKEFTDEEASQWQPSDTDAGTGTFSSAFHESFLAALNKRKSKGD